MAVLVGVTTMKRFLINAEMTVPGTVRNAAARKVGTKRLQNGRKHSPL